jgi:hypothetical protein
MPNKSICDDLIVRPGGPAGWEILCPPGPLAQLLGQLSREDESQEPTATHSGQPPLLVIAFTSALDSALTELIDALISVRYEAGRVQLTLFGQEIV